MSRLHRDVQAEKELAITGGPEAHLPDEKGATKTSSSDHQYDGTRDEFDDDGAEYPTEEELEKLRHVPYGASA